MDSLERKCRNSLSRPSRSLAFVQPGDLRISPLLGIPSLLVERGIDPSLAIARADVDAALFQHIESRISFEAAGRLLAVCAEMTACRDFGLLLGARSGLKALGPIGELMRHSASVGDALKVLIRYFHLHNRGATPVLMTLDRSSALLGYSIFRHGWQGMSQIHDTAVAIGFKLLRELCGPAFTPIRAQFAHGRPRGVAPYGRLFRSDLAFDADISAIVFDASWLSRPVEGADETLRNQLRQALLKAEAEGPIPFGERVESALHQLVLSGEATADKTAALFAIHERTLRRLLREEGTSLRELIGWTRFQLARQLLSNTSMPVSDIAAALHYTDPNAFSRAFRAWADLSPAQWREAERGTMVAPER